MAIESPRLRNILIALPTVSQSMMSGTAVTIAKVMNALHSRGIGADLHNIDSAEIVTARDMFANMVLHSNSWDGLLFIDSDMAFSPRLVLKLVDKRADVTAAVCPRRILNLDRLVQGARTHGDLLKATAQASEFTVKFDWEGRRNSPERVIQGFCSAAAVGMACALISRKALIQMSKTDFVQPRHDLRTSGGATCWSFFGNVETEGHRFGEDYSFCYRWTALMKQKLWVCIDEHVTHIGRFDYKARYADLL